MVRRAPGASDARVYDVSSRALRPLGASLNVGRKSEEALRRAQRKINLNNSDTDLIQDFAFPTVSQRIKVSRDGRYIFASGTYPPQLHVYDTEELSLKFKRHVDNDIIDFQILDDDWRKFVIVTADRYLDFHSQFGSHYKTRVPTCARDLMVHRGTADLFVCGQGPSVWRFNLDQGRFLAPLETLCGGRNSGINVCGISPVNSLVAFGGDSGLLDIYDPRLLGRKRTPIATLDVTVSLPDRQDGELSAFRFDDHDGVTMALGTSSGYTLMYDLRSSQPLITRDHGNGLPMRSIRFHDDRKHCVTADVKSVKIWRRDSTMNTSVIEPDADINHLCIVGASGVMCTAVEAPRVKTFYVPALGVAPRWCAFLDTFTEELENGRDVRAIDLDEGKGTGEEEEQVYENYRFVTKEELQGLGLSHLVGSDVLKAYMHGYFVHSKLYRRALEVVEPFAYEKYRKQKAREKVEALRESRISKVKRMKPKKVEVNQGVVDDLVERQKCGKRGAKADLSVLQDGRFSAMFSNSDFAVDENAERFQFLNPSGSVSAKRGKQQEEREESDNEHLEQFEDNESDENEIKGSSMVTEDLWSSDDEVDSDSEDSDSGGENEADMTENRGIRKATKNEM